VESTQRNKINIDIRSGFKYFFTINCLSGITAKTNLGKFHNSNLIKTEIMVAIVEPL